MPVGAVRYVRPLAEDPENHSIEGVMRKHKVQIHSARELTGSPIELLAERGFSTIEFRSSVADSLGSIQNPLGFREDKTPQSNFTTQVRDRYKSEVEQLLCKLLGARHCFTRFHLIRHGQKTTKGVETILNYGNFVHSDFAENVLCDAAQYLQRCGLSADEADNSDVVYINVWQPIVYPVEQNPLAVLDVSSFDPAQIRLGDERVFPERKGTPGEQIVSLVPHNRSHRWFYYPAMRPDELLLFVQLDSRHPNRHVFHTSFVDNDALPNARPRKSIELKCVCTFTKPKAQPQLPQARQARL